MADPEDRDLSDLVVDRVNNSIVALSHTVSVVVTRQLLRTLWAGFSGEFANLPYDPQSVLPGPDGFELLAGGRLNEETI
jgi:hypothetical protein